MTTNEQAEYTPTTADVRTGFSAKPYLVMPQGPAESLSEYLGRVSRESKQCQILSGEAFDRWLAEHDREAAEKAWDEGYDYCANFEGAEPVNPYRKES